MSFPEHTHCSNCGRLGRKQVLPDSFINKFVNRILSLSCRSHPLIVLVKLLPVSLLRVFRSAGRWFKNLQDIAGKRCTQLQWRVHVRFLSFGLEEYCMVLERAIQKKCVVRWHIFKLVSEHGGDLNLGPSLNICRVEITASRANMDKREELASLMKDIEELRAENTSLGCTKVKFGVQTSCVEAVLKQQRNGILWHSYCEDSETGLWLPVDWQLDLGVSSSPV